MLVAFILRNEISGIMEVSKIHEVPTLAKAEVLMRACGYDTFMEVDTTVKPGMIYDNGKIITYNYTTGVSKKIYPPDTFSEQLNGIKDKLKIVDPDELSLDELKEYRINKSKENLEKFFEEAYVVYNGGKYSVTMDHQTRLFMHLGMYKTVTDMGGVYPLKWNERGKSCIDRTYEELLGLSNTIAAFVIPKVSEQQEIESRIKLAETKDEVMTIGITFNFTPSANESTEESPVDSEATEE